MSSPTGPVLDYSTPRVFLDRPYRHRSANQVLGAVAILIFATVLAWFSTKVPSRPDLPWIAARTILRCGALAAALGFCWMSLKFFRGDVDNARITQEGIEVRHRVYAWDRIRAVYGKQVAGGIMVEFDLRPPSDKSYAMWLLQIPRALMTTPFLQLKEFEQLMDELKAAIVPNHPHLKLERTPRRND